MTDYPFEQIIAADPSNPNIVASNGVITIFAPGDASKTPIELKTLSGLPLPNPITVNKLGMGPAFIAQLWQVAWEGGGLSNTFTSNIGLRDEAVAAVSAAQDAQAAAETAAANAAAGASEALAGAVGSAESAAASAAASAALVEAPADTAVQTLITSTGSATRAALKTTVAGEVTDTASATHAALSATILDNITTEAADTAGPIQTPTAAAIENTTTPVGAATKRQVYLLKRSSIIDVHDPAWDIDQMIADGVAITTELQAILDESVADSRARAVELGRLYGLIDAPVIIPNGGTMRGPGIGGYLTTAALSGACLVRKTGFNGDMIRFAASSLEGGRANMGPFTLEGFALYSQTGNTGGRGIAFKTSDGTPGIIQDTVRLHDLLIRRQPEGGILWPAGGRPMHITDVNCLWNGGPGYEFIADQGTGTKNLTSSILFNALSGDGNVGGLLVIRGGDENAAFTIISPKSERRVNPHYGNVAQQDNAIVLDNVASEVTVIGATHISSIPNGATFEPPGALVEVKGAALPKLRWLGSTVRVRDTDVAVSVLPYMVLDSQRGITVARPQGSGTYGQDEVAVARTKERLDTGESTIPRRNLTSTAIAGSTGNGFLTYFTAEKTELVGSILTETQATAAAGVTHGYVALYEENPTTRDLTLLCSSADTLTLWGTANTEYTTAMTDQTKWKVKGRRYAVMILCAATTMPNFGGNQSLSATRAAKPPRLAGRLNGITAPPASITAASIASTNLQFAADVLPV